MKKILTIILILISFSFLAFFSYGQTITPEASSTPKISITNQDQKAIENLKEKVANKVQEIIKKNNKAIVGRVTSISDNLIKIKSVDNKEYEIKIDSTLTKFYKISGVNQKEIKIDDIAKNDYLIVSGIINDKTVDANAVFIDQPFLVESGKVIEVNKENYTVKVITSDKTVYTLSFETFTKQYILNIKTLDIEKSGFSKMIVGDRIHFIAEIKGNEKDNTYEAAKTLLIPQEYFIK
ncbi:MAG: hypothetical protein KatS3mg092_0934 [Patescibacteria group bacterium]|nr:MAG: hypothetical protein KatS3mg092_0934 [Patescibacteria group bacterium]